MTTGSASLDLNEKLNLVYFLYGKTYINITNACTNSCAFCLRNDKDDVKGAYMWHNNLKVTSEDVIAQIEEKKADIKDEIVFCGYGEPLVKFDEVIKVSKYIKENMPDLKIRINTNGHGNHIAKRNIVPELASLIDSVSISLNAQNEELYNKISKPSFEGAYKAMLDFAKLCIEAGIDTTLSVVSGYKADVFPVDVKMCEDIALKMGAKFRAREWIQNGY